MNPRISTETGRYKRTGRIAFATGAAAVTAVAVLGPSVSQWNDERKEKAHIENVLHQKNLINEFDDGVAPKELAGTKLGTFTLGQGETVSDYAQVFGKNALTVQGQGYDQTEGAVGATAVVRLSDIDMNKADLTEPDPVTGLPEIVPEQQ